MLNPKRRSTLRRPFITKTEDGYDKYDHKRISRGERGIRELLDDIHEDHHSKYGYNTYLIERVLALWEVGFSVDHIAEATELTYEEVVELVEADNEYETTLRETLRVTNF